MTDDEQQFARSKESQLWTFPEKQELSDSVLEFEVENETESERTHCYCLRKLRDSCRLPHGSHGNSTGVLLRWTDMCFCVSIMINDQNTRSQREIFPAK